MLEVSLIKQLQSFSLNIKFQAGQEIVGLLGPSGCGKSMTLQCIAGLVAPDRGEIRLNEKILFHSEQRINTPPRFRKVGYVFQQYALFPHMTVADNIAYGISHVDKKIRRSMVEDMISRMHLEGLHHRYPGQLSGGQQQRVALARTLITQPDLLLLDEPFSALDNHIKHQLEEDLLHTLKEHYGGTVLLVTHNMDEAFRLCNRVLLLSEGQLIQEGSREDIVEQPRTIASARILGCKNLFAVQIKQSSSEYMELHSEHIVLQIPQRPLESSFDSFYAGFHSHHVQVNSQDYEGENCFNGQVIDILKGLFYATVIIQCGNQEIQAELHIQEMERRQIHLSQEVFFQIPAQFIFVISA